MSMFFDINSNAVIRCNWCRHVFLSVNLLTEALIIQKLAPFVVEKSLQ